MLGIGGLLALAGCSNGNAAPAPTARAVEPAPLIPTVEPIRPEPLEAPVAGGDEVEMPIEVVERRPRAAAAPASNDVTAPSAAARRMPLREPILSDQLLADDAPAPIEKAAPIALPPPEPPAPPAGDGLSDEDRALIAAATARPAPAEMIARREPEVKTTPAGPPSPIAAVPNRATDAPPAAAATRTSSVTFGPTTSMSTSSLSPTDVRKTIQRSYLDGIRACHVRALETDDGASGTVTAQINVGPDGQVAVARAFGFSSAVDACIKAAARTWRFDVPRDAAGQPTTAPFKIELRLAPR